MPASLQICPVRITQVGSCVILTCPHASTHLSLHSYTTKYFRFVVQSMSFSLDSLFPQGFLISFSVARYLKSKIWLDTNLFSSVSQSLLSICIIHCAFMLLSLIPLQKSQRSIFP